MLLFLNFLAVYDWDQNTYGSAFISEFKGIRQEVVENLSKPSIIPKQLAKEVKVTLLTNLSLKLDLVAFSFMFEYFSCLPNKSQKVKILIFYGEFIVF